jgi:hypothetical protein
MNKILSLTLLAGLALGAAAPASASFSGAYAVANWTASTAHGGSIDTSGAPNSIALVSSNDGGGPSNQDFTITAVAADTVSFDWDYGTADEGPSHDPFGYLLNNVFFQLTNNAGAKAQAGSFSFPVLAGDVFGFRARSGDSCCGAATTTVSNFNIGASVPEPGTLALLALGGMMGLRRRTA